MPVCPWDPLSPLLVARFQAMKKIMVDKRYGALKTLGERKQAFNEVSGRQA